MTRTDLDLTIPVDEPVMEMRRFVKAPPALVFEAFTTAEGLRHWWGPRHLELVVCEIDLRVGGSYRFVQRAPDGREFAFHGGYREVDPPQRLVMTFAFEGFPDGEAVDTVTFAPVDGGTMIGSRTLHPTLETRDAHIANGMEGGMIESYERLDEWLSPASSRP